MADTYTKQAGNQILSVTLRDLGIDESTTYGKKKKKNYNKLFVQLTLFTPTNQSHLGIKFDDYTKLNTRNTDKFLQQLFSGLGLKNIYFFDAFETRKTGKIDLYNSVVMDNEAMLCLRCVNGAKKSLYMAVRNAIAHGNIIYDGRYYILYSVSDDKIEYDSAITFYMRIKSLKLLESMNKVLEIYK